MSIFNSILGKYVDVNKCTREAFDLARAHGISNPDCIVLTLALCAAFERIEELEKILDNNIVVLSNRDKDLLLANIENPPEPNEELKALFKKDEKE